jgi:uroporphyrinogen decarboxylase
VTPDSKALEERVMNSRDRVLEALNHQEPDRVPLDLGGTSASNILAPAYERLKAQLGLAEDKPIVPFLERSEAVRVDAEIQERFGIDVDPIPSDHRRFGTIDIDADHYVDEWGVTWGRPKGGHYINVKSPFAGNPDVAALDRHDWPDPNDPGRVRGLKEAAEELRRTGDRALVVWVPARVLTRGQHLCGFQDWFTYLLAEPRFAEALMDKVVEIEIGICQQMLEALGDSVDVVMVSEDLGMQDRLQVSPKLFRGMIKPRLKQIYEFIKSQTKAKLMLHSDGAIFSIIGDLIEIGVEVLNPVQVSCEGMDTARLKREFGADLAFWGAVDTHHVLPHGTPQEVAEEVRRRIDDLAPGGGYVLASVHNIQREVPPENVVVMFDTALEYGQYR